MHEFSIAMSIIEIAENEAAKVNSSTISSLDLDIGTMAGIEFYALDTALEMAIKETMLEDADIKVRKITAIAKCSDCGFEFEIVNITDACPECNSLFSDVICGKELKIRSIVVEEEA